MSEVKEKSIYTHMLRGSAWAIAARWGVRAIGFISVFALARLLKPEDFGVVAMGSLTIGFINGFTEIGVQTLLIRERDANREHIDTAWTIKILQGLLVALFLTSCAPLAARYFDDGRIIPVLYVLAISAVFNGAQNIGLDLARKDLDFAREFRFQIYVRAMSFFITVSLAYYLRTYWALVFGQTLSSVLSLPLSYWMHPYRPRLSLVKAREYLRFSTSFVPLKAGRYLNEKVDVIIVGGLGGTTQLGAYNVASDLSAMLTREILSPVARGLLPTYAKLSHDLSELATAYKHVMATSGIIILPVGFGLFAVAREAVPVILGPQWVAAVPLVRMLALYGMLSGLIHMMSGQVLIVSGHERSTAVLMWIRLVLLVSIVWVTGKFWGVEAVATGAVVAGVAALPFVVYELTQCLPLTSNDVISALGRPLIASAAMAASVRLLAERLAPGALGSLIVEILAGITVYLSLLMLLWWLFGRPSGLERLATDFVAARISRKPC